MEPNEGLLAEPAHDPRLPTPQVLYIEDDENDFLLAQIACKRSGAPFTLISARSGNEALEWLGKIYEEGRPLPHMILLDVNLEGRKDGLEVLQTLRNHPELNHIPVVLLTGVLDPTLLAQARLLGAQDLIEKTGHAELATRLFHIATKVGQRATKPFASLA